MKKPFTFILALVLCSGIFAQDQNFTKHLKSTLTQGLLPDSTIGSIMDGVWTPQFKNVFSYDGNKTETMNYYWDAQTSSWQPQIKTLDTYNEDGNRVNQFRVAWNAATSLWDTLTNHTYTWDPVLGVTSWIYETWDPTTRTWNDLMKGEYDYSENGLHQTYLLCQWNTSLSRWDSLHYAVWIMNVEGKDSTGSYYRWTNQETPRYLDYNYMISYDENGRDTLYYEEDPADPDYRYKFVTEYDNEGLKMNETSYDWVNNAWERTYRSEYAYDEDGNLVLLTNLEWNDQAWIPVRKEQNYYATGTAIDKKPADPGFMVYPNPAREFIRFSVSPDSAPAMLSLYNLKGTKVLDEMIFGNTPVSVGTLSKGMYIYRLEKGGKVFRGKIILE